MVGIPVSSCDGLFLGGILRPKNSLASFKGFLVGRKHDENVSRWKIFLDLFFGCVVFALDSTVLEKNSAFGEENHLSKHAKSCRNRSHFSTLRVAFRPKSSKWQMADSLLRSSQIYTTSSLRWRKRIWKKWYHFEGYQIPVPKKIPTQPMDVL